MKRTVFLTMTPEERATAKAALAGLEWVLAGTCSAEQAEIHGKHIRWCTKGDHGSLDYVDEVVQTLHRVSDELRSRDAAHVLKGIYGLPHDRESASEIALGLAVSNRRNAARIDVLAELLRAEVAAARADLREQETRSPRTTCCRCDGPYDEEIDSLGVCSECVDPRQPPVPEADEPTPGTTVHPMGDRKRPRPACSRCGTLMTDMSGTDRFTYNRALVTCTPQESPA